MIAFGRRAVVAGALSLVATAGTASPPATRPVHGLIGKMRAVAGQRDALITVLLEGSGTMPGCLSYVVARDAADADAIWITELWDSRDSHRASLQLPQVRAAIIRARPLIAGFDMSVETEPAGDSGVGCRRVAPD